MKLFYAPGLCSLSPHIALRETGLPFELAKVDIKTKKVEDGRDYLTINPKGYVPALELDDGSVLTEGPAIVQYLADLAPQSGLAPANGTPERYRLQESLGFINSELHKSFGLLFKPDVPESYKDVVKAGLGKRFDYLSEVFTGRDWLLGDRFSAADGYLFVVLNWSKWVGIELAKWPVLTAFMERVASRPAVQAALRAEHLIS